MIRLRQTIERGVRHRWLGPLFVILFCLMLALLYLHAMHDGGHSAATELGEFCLGLTIMFSLLIVIRVHWRVILSLALPRSGRAPPAPLPVLPRVRPVALGASLPLRL